VVNEPKTILTEPKYYNIEAEVVKYAEVKAITGGVTSIQGSPDLAATRLLVRNIEHANFNQDRIRQYGLSVSDARWQKDVKEKILPQINSGVIDAFLVHLAEGIDSLSRAEFQTLKKIGMLNDVLVGIHCTGLKQADFKEMAQVGAKMVWSPLSNLLLYGKTADVVAALKENVMVALGTDWSPSGCKNLLGELKIAAGVDSTLFGNVISDTLLCKMVTSNPAFILGIDDKVGSISDGMYADIAVFSKANKSNPYSSLVQSNEKNVNLVIIGGEPLYGDWDIMKGLKQDDAESLFVAGCKKGLDMRTPNVPKGEQTFQEIKLLLDRAMQFDIEDMYNAFGNGLSEGEFKVMLDKKFPQGLFPQKLDPIYAFGDEQFFTGIKNSTIANLQFDFTKFWTQQLESPLDRVIAFVNDSRTTIETLDVNVGLDIRAAKNIINHRNGKDLIVGNTDDNFFNTIEEIDSVPYVGNSAINKLEMYFK
jgi:hypothetical protein